MNLGTLIPLILKLLPLISKLKDLIAQPGIKEILDIILPLVSQLFPGTAGGQDPQQVIEHVNWIQTSLNKLGQAPALTVDGSYGAMTKAAVAAFQTKAGLTADGWVGPLTEAAIKKAVALQG